MDGFGWVCIDLIRFGLSLMGLDGFWMGLDGFEWFRLTSIDFNGREWVLYGFGWSWIEF